MIISRAPMRITLGGGGTDLPSFYEKEEGFLINGAINKYVFISTNEQYNKTYKLNYSHMEEVEDIDDIKHPLFREALRYYDIEPGIEIHSMADIPGGKGLGSSGSFLVALLQNLHFLKYGEIPYPRKIAEDACKIEINILKEHEGKQDKYVAAFGGVKAYKFHKDGRVSVSPLMNEDMILNELEEHLTIFPLNIRRKGTASDTLSNIDDKMKKDDKHYIDLMKKIKYLGLETKRLLENYEFDSFGETLNTHWELKKEWHPDVTNKRIDKLYQAAMDLGCLGGKTIGAPGGGFIMFYHPSIDKDKWVFLAEMWDEFNIEPLNCRFVDEGVSLLWGEHEY